VLGHGGLADRERIDELSDRTLAGAQQIADPPPIRFSKNLEHETNIAKQVYNCQGIC
jgi:hypothetical protein